MPLHLWYFSDLKHLDKIWVTGMRRVAWGPENYFFLSFLETVIKSDVTLFYSLGDKDTKS